ncbi:MAG: hypothetical protein O3A20_02000 [Planctomycetota bacterium]|nr:hypothetical protein [Planctomycetota bacterium]
MPAALALISLLCPALQTAAQLAPVPIAVTESGLRVESRDAAVGDRRVATPFGELSLPLDPVASVIDGAAQLEQLLALHRAGTLDDHGLAQDLSTAGQLSALVEHATHWTLRDPQSVEPYLILEAWGERIDPAPRELAREKRVDWLWERALERDWAKAVLIGPRLRAEVSAAYQARSEQTISISTLRKALRSRDPQLRRIAAFVAGKQQEFSLRAPLLLASLTDVSPAARDGAALAAQSVQPKAARDYWSRVLANGAPTLRGQAALDLGRHGGREGMRALVHVLAAWDKSSGDRFEFAARDIFVVSNYDSNAHDQPGYDVNHLDRAFSSADPTREYVDLGSRFKVTRYDESLLKVLLEALDLWAEEPTGRDAVQWLDWYLNEAVGQRP